MLSPSGQLCGTGAERPLSLATCFYSIQFQKDILVSIDNLFISSFSNNLIVFSVFPNWFVLSQQLDTIHVLQHFEPLESMYNLVVCSSIWIRWKFALLDILFLIYIDHFLVDQSEKTILFYPFKKVTKWNILYNFIYLYIIHTFLDLKKVYVLSGLFCIFTLHGRGKEGVKTLNELIRGTTVS